MERFRFINNKNFDELPKTSGVYSFWFKNEAIYIGKAINIQNRVKNHFNQPSYRDNLFMDKVDKIGFFETNSEIEALILEANLIKKYQPKFNVVWKDGKNYFYVAIAQNQNKIPYVFITHQPNLDSRLRGNDGKGRNSEYIGPFVEGTALKKTLRFLRRVFPYYTTKKHPKNKCTYCHLGLCPGPQPDLKEYKNNIKKLILILQGKRNAVLNSLKKEMNLLSKENKFEEAGKIRDRIYNLQQVMSHTHVINDAHSMYGFLPNGKKPYEWQKTGKTLKKLLWPSLLGAEATKQSINRIECYDISNIQGKQATGSMVVFTDGQPDKSQYKKFKIKLQDTPNDIAMLKEVLQRRFAHAEWNYPEVILIDGGKAQLNVALSVIARSEATWQSLHVIPAKAGIQIHATWIPDQVGDDIKNIKIISIAKGRQELFIQGRKDPIPLKNLPQEIYNLVKQLDDEAHRFAITYHKKLRKKNLLQ